MELAWLSHISLCGVIKAMVLFLTYHPLAARNIGSWQCTTTSFIEPFAAGKCLTWGCVPSQRVTRGQKLVNAELKGLLTFYFRTTMKGIPAFGMMETSGATTLQQFLHLLSPAFLISFWGQFLKAFFNKPPAYNSSSENLFLWNPA